MYLNINELIKESETPKVLEQEFITRPGTTFKVKKLRVDEYLRSQNDLRTLHEHFAKLNDEANKGKAEDDPTRSEQWVQVPIATMVKYALLNEKGEPYFAGQDIVKVYEILQGLTMDVFAEISQAVRKLNPTTAGELEAAREEAEAAKAKAEEEKKQLETATASEKSTA